MGKPKLLDSFVKTEGHCLLCLREVSPQLTTTSVKVEPGTEERSNSFQSEEQFISYANAKHSLQYLSHYLKLDLGEVIKSARKLRKTKSKSKPRRSNLSVMLCEGCGTLNGRFTELYQQLEGIQMKVTTCLNAISEKLTGSEGLMMDHPVKAFLGRTDARILEEVRGRIMQECLLKLKRAPPEVEITKLEEADLEEGDVEYEYPSSSRGATKVEVVGMDEDLEASHQPDFDPFNMEMENNLVWTSGDEPNSPHFLDASEAFEEETSQPNADMDFDYDVKRPASSPAKKKKVSVKKSLKKRSTKPKAPPKNKYTYVDLSVERNPTTDKFKCPDPDCDKEFMLAFASRSHYRIAHLKIKNFSCDLCGKQFSHKATLLKHHDYVHLKKSKTHQCDECGMQFAQSGSLKVHHEKVHLKLKPYKCDEPECQKEFSGKADLQRYQQSVHLKVKSYQCNECGAQFSRPDVLLSHHRFVHLKVRKWVCDHCGHGFALQVSLNRHVQTVHLKLKNHECEHCGKKYGTSVEVRRHIESAHLKIKRVCEECGKSFNRECTLQRHRKRKHLNQVPVRQEHPSGHCGKTLSSKRHVDSVHLNIRHGCEECGQSFTRLWELGRHRKSHHPDLKHVTSATVTSDPDSDGSPC